MASFQEDCLPAAWRMDWQVKGGRDGSRGLAGLWLGTRRDDTGPTRVGTMGLE